MLTILGFLKPYRVQIAFIFLLVFLQSMADLYLPTLMADIVNHGISRGDTGYILGVGGLMLAVAIANGGCAVTNTYMASRVGAGFIRTVRTRLFSHVESFSLQEFDKFSPASLITRTTNDTNQLPPVLIMVLRMMVRVPMMCIGGIVLALVQDSSLAWVVIIPVPVITAIIVTIIIITAPLFRVMQSKVDKLNLILDEGLTGVRVIRSFDRTGYETRRFDRANLDVTNTAIRVNQISALLMPVMMLILNFSTIAIIWFGSIQVANGETQVGTLIAFLQYAMLILFTLLMLSTLFVMLPRAGASAARIEAVLKVKPEIKDTETRRPPAEQGGLVQFENVSFSYPGAEEPALSNISFRAEPGQVTAIVGGTGAGKSTLVNLVLRFYDVQEGRVLVAGVDVREMSQKELRAKTGYVPQRALLFSGTINDNIRYGKENATPDEIHHAAEVAQAHEFITAMPQNFDAIIAQGGNNVSGGQKQRLAIARALVRQPQIYIFDDSFSALDFQTEARLRAVLRQETHAATVLIVAQRVNTVMDADQIIVLDEGRIVGIGRHRDLLQKSEVYREIVSSQLSLEEIA